MAEAPFPPPSKLWESLATTAPEAVQYAKNNPEAGPDRTVPRGRMGRRRSKFKDQLAPLHCLALMGRYDIIANMIREYDNIQINVLSCTKKWTPLMFAIQGGHIDVTKQLLDNGAIVNHKGTDGSTALHLGVGLGCLITVKTLLEYGGKVNVQDKRGDTPLHLCMGHVGTATTKFGTQQRLEMTDLLIRFGASVNLINNMGDTALHVCLHYAHEVSISRLLLSSASAKSCLTTANDAGHIPLQLSTDVPSTELLIIQGSPIDYQGPDGRTVLHMKVSHPNLVTLLLDHKADVNLCDKQGRTPLHLGMADRSTPRQSMCHLLMSMADVNIQDNHGNTPLHLACYRRQSLTRNSPVIDLLVNKGANIDLQNSKGETPLYVSLRCGHQKHATQLYDAGASLDIEDGKGMSSRSLNPHWVRRMLTGKQDAAGEKKKNWSENLTGTVVNGIISPFFSQSEESAEVFTSSETSDSKCETSKSKITKNCNGNGNDSDAKFSTMKLSQILNEFDLEQGPPVSRQPSHLAVQSSAYIHNTSPITSSQRLPGAIFPSKSNTSPEIQLTDFRNHFKTLCEEVTSFKELLEEAFEQGQQQPGFHSNNVYKLKKATVLSDIKGRNIPSGAASNKSSNSPALSANRKPRYSPETVCEKAYQIPGEMDLLRDEIKTLAAVLQDVYQDEESAM